MRCEVRGLMRGDGTVRISVEVEAELRPQRWVRTARVIGWR